MDTEYDPVRSYKLARYAKLVYDRDDVLSSPLGAQVLVSSPANGEFVVSVRGSSQWMDWFMNVIPFRKRMNERWAQGATLRRGFYAQFKSIKDSLSAALEDLPPCVVDVTGHSLGGGIAPIVSLMVLHETHHKLRFVYTMNPARPGGRKLESLYDKSRNAFGDKLRQATHRVVHTRDGVEDVVTRLPPRSLGYRHFGTPTIIEGPRRWTGDDGRREWARLTRENRIARWRLLSRLRIVNDNHAMNSLLEDLKMQSREENGLKGL